MTRTLAFAMTAALCAPWAWAQPKGFDFDWSKLAPKAAETVEVNLDENMLRMAGRFMAGKEGGDEAAVKDLLKNLRGIYVRVFRFNSAGEYSLGDVEKFRSQYNGGGWNKIVDTRSGKPGGENTGVYMKTNGDVIQGLVVIAAEPKELTVVNIMGDIRPEQIQELGGKFGIPNIGLPDVTKRELKRRTKDEDE